MSTRIVTMVEDEEELGYPALDQRFADCVLIAATVVVAALFAAFVAQLVQMGDWRDWVTCGAAAVVWFLLTAWCTLTGVEGGIGGLASRYNDWWIVADTRLRPAPGISVFISCATAFSLLVVFYFIPNPAIRIVGVSVATLFLLPIASLFCERWD